MAAVSPLVMTNNDPQLPPVTSIEAKLVILGAASVGKTSLLQRYLNPAAPFSQHVQSTVGASFITQKIWDPESSTVLRLQLWDTAGQERFRSISRLYYRGAHAALLCYDVTNEKSWEEMKGWLREMKGNCDENEHLIIHVVGTKTDLVAADPARRQVAFERTIAYVAEQIASDNAHAPAFNFKGGGLQSPDSKRSSGLWNQDLGWDSCHEVNAKDGEGIEEVFRVIARKLIEQKHKREASDASKTSRSGAGSQSGDDYFAGIHGHTGSFRLGYGDKRRSWLGLPSVGLGIGEIDGTNGPKLGTSNPEEARRRGRCC